jgi:translocation and assembly module TamB
VGGGAADAEIRLSGDELRQNLTATARVTVPALRLDADRVLRGKTLNIDVAVSDLFGTPKGRAKLDAEAVAVDELGLDTLSLALDGGPEEVAWRLAAEGAWRGTLVLVAEGRLKIGAEGQSLEVARLQGKTLGRDFALRAPVTLTQTGDGAAMGPLNLRFGEAVIQAQGRIDPAEISAQLAIDALPISSLAAVLPTEGVKGTLNARFALAGPRANPSGDGEVHVSGVEIESILEGPILGLDATARWREGRLSVAGAVTGLPGDDARLTAEVPLRLDPAGLAPVVSLEEAIVGQVIWRGDMGAIWPLVPIEGHRLSGDVDVTLTVAGTAGQPRLEGAVALSGGAYENLDAGTLLKDLNARIEFDERRAHLAHLSANDGATGTLSASGEIAIDAEADFPLSIDLRMTDFAAVRRDEVDAVIDGEVAVTGTATAVLVAGRFETKSVEIRIVDSLPPEVVTLNVVETGPGANTEALRVAPAKAVADGTIDLDIVVAMPRRVFVRGRGLDSEWAGNLKVTGPASAPNIVGEVKLVRGQLSLLTKTFRLTSGTVRFPPGAGAVPELEVTAEHKTDDITAIAGISGPITNPTFVLSSSPELPQDEIVSTVLFGKKQGQLSALEAAQLAIAVAELADAGGTGSILDSARKLIGVDVLRITGGDDSEMGGPSVEAGTYAAEGVYFGVKQGVSDESGAVAVEIEVTPNISVESEVGITGESDIGIKFKWDY